MAPPDPCMFMLTSRAFSLGSLLLRLFHALCNIGIHICVQNLDGFKDRADMLFLVMFDFP
jgi:hypothetical protein